MVPPVRVMLLAGVDNDPPQVFDGTDEVLTVRPVGKVFDYPTAVSA
jgi:hypothetical protein